MGLTKCLDTIKNQPVWNCHWKSISDPRLN